MKAVINATPLIALALVHQLDVLYHLFEEVLVPPVVYDEVTATPTHRDSGHCAVCFSCWLSYEGGSIRISASDD